MLNQFTNDTIAAVEQDYTRLITILIGPIIQPAKFF